MHAAGEIEGNDGLSVRGAYLTADPNGLNSPGSILIEARGVVSERRYQRGH